MRKTITLQVVGEKQIACDGCEQRIEKLLKNVEGVEKVRASARTQRVELLVDDTRLDAAAIARRLETIGYATEAPKSK